MQTTLAELLVAIRLGRNPAFLLLLLHDCGILEVLQADLLCLKVLKLLNAALRAAFLFTEEL